MNRFHSADGAAAHLMAVTTAANQLLKRAGALEPNMFIGDPALLVHALSTLENKLDATAASSPPAAQGVDEQTWQQCCDDQGGGPEQPGAAPGGRPARAQPDGGTGRVRTPVRRRRERAHRG